MTPCAEKCAQSRSRIRCKRMLEGVEDPLRTVTSLPLPGQVQRRWPCQFLRSYQQQTGQPKQQCGCPGIAYASSSTEANNQVGLKLFLSHRLCLLDMLSCNKFVWFLFLIGMNPGTSFHYEKNIVLGSTTWDILEIDDERRSMLKNALNEPYMYKYIGELLTSSTTYYIHIYTYTRLLSSLVLQLGLSTNSHACQVLDHINNLREHLWDKR